MGVQITENEISECDIAKRADCAEDAAEMLRSFAHEGRLLILWHLTSGEKTVSELSALVTCRQSAISQQIGRLRMEGIVKRRREGKISFYKIADPRYAILMETVQELFGPSSGSHSIENND